jgi:nitroreductase
MLSELIIKRKSIKQFDEKKLESDEIISLFEAARRAPSAFNEQPWRFILASRNNTEEFNAILNTLADKNREWAINASVLVIVIAKKELSRNQKQNRHYLYDTASAVANLTFQANSIDLYVHQMGGFDYQKVADVFSVPEEFEPVVVLAIGGNKTSIMNSNNMQLEINRKPISEILFENKFGESHSVLNNENAFINF